MRHRLTPAQLRLLILIATTLAACLAALMAIDAERAAVAPTTAPATTIAATSTSTSSTSTTTTTTTTTTLVAAAELAVFRCPEWVAINHLVGFPVEELATADRILYAESRCRLTAVNGADPAGGSWCAYQVNRIHEGHLLEAGVIDYWEQLIEDPRYCAAAAFVVYTRSNGWTPWATY